LSLFVVPLYLILKKARCYTPKIENEATRGRPHLLYYYTTIALR
jgi:hypothetical protein